MAPLLEVQEIIAGYGKKQVLDKVSVSVQQNEVVVLLGHNASGKTTMLRAIFGIVHITQGIVTFEGKEVTNRRSSLTVKNGIRLISQEGTVFPDLTVADNLRLGAFTINNKAVKKTDKILFLLDSAPMINPRVVQVLNVYQFFHDSKNSPILCK